MKASYTDNYALFQSEEDDTLLMTSVMEVQSADGLYLHNVSLLTKCGDVIQYHERRRSFGWVVTKARFRQQLTMIAAGTSDVEPH